MLKFIGAVFVGLLTMGAAAYFMARPQEQRSSDFSTAKNLAFNGIAGIKKYVSDLLSSKSVPARGDNLAS